ncbi:MAG: glycosyl hydrolase family 8 [Lachnospiraceae bacterium]|nr:glycosyl hydrolase family 8 [Lachnospiraceae bacterium]
MNFKHYYIAILVFLTLGFTQAGCAGNKEAEVSPVPESLNETRPKISKPFPWHTSYEVAPMLPSNKTREQLDDKIIALFRQFLINDLIVDENSPANKDEFRMVFRHYQSWAIREGSIPVSHLTVSESHGYGMMMLVYMSGSEDRLSLTPEQWIYGCADLQAYFNAMLRTVIAFPSVTGGDDNKLFAWELNGYPADGDNRTGYKEIDGIKSAPFKRPSSGSCATDGDMDIIFALLLADRQWGSNGEYDYRAYALEMLDSLWRYCVNKDTYTLLLGDWAMLQKTSKLGKATRSSDFILSHLKAFAEVDEAHDWHLVINATYDVIRDIREAENMKGNLNGFLPDFIVREGDEWKVPDGHVLEGSNDGAFAYNACRIPWRLATDYLLFGNTEIGDATLFDYIIAPLDEFAQGIGNMNSFGPFNMDGSSVGWTDPHLFTPPFLLTAAANADDQAWVDKFWDWGIDDYKGDNYADYIKFFVMLTASGNYWQP